MSLTPEANLIIHALLSDPAARYTDLGADY